MKQNIHPKLHKNAKVTDLSTNKSFNLASTKEEITVEVTNLSHPFYTGNHKIVDTENLVKKFESRRSSTNIAQVQSKKEKSKLRSQKVTAMKAQKSLTLRDILSQVK